ncbi:chitinase [Pseudoalteromonas phenolica]|uniref:Ig-like domain-containing protein n=1 Tax=Pseudoalteromonas phenolica TaxID=161398 RepID=UPI00110AAFB3|nr:Ig-like domain-containing protein [Pseudoalteromonas phenolica]TMN87541.1 chitinase [Pseudoalteromonas phenolica]
MLINKGKVLTAAIISSVLLPITSFAFDCSSLSSWQPSVAYTSGQQVVYQQNAYKANWWTQNQNPADNSGPWQEWSSLGICSNGNQSPLVSLISPLNGATLSKNDSAIISAEANDTDGTIVQVEFFLNGQSLAIDNIAPYQVNWTAGLGEYTVTAKAIDNEGSETVSMAHVINVIDPDQNASPIVTLTSPSSNSQLKVDDLVTVSADASDIDGSISSVSFYVDNVEIGNVTEAPYNVTWQATEGVHRFQAKAIDNEQATSFSQSVELNVENNSSGGCAGVPSFNPGATYQAGDVVENVNHKFTCKIAGWCSSNSTWAYEPGVGLYWEDAWVDNSVCAIAPEVVFTSPSDNATVLLANPLDISVSANDQDGRVTSVTLLVDQQQVAVISTPPYATQWTPDTIGEKQLQAIAVDNEGNTSEVSVLINVTDQSLVTSLTSPVSGDRITLGSALTLSANATALDGSVSSVSFSVNGQIVATDTSAPYKATYTPGASGSYSIAAIATDSNNNTATSNAVSVSVVDAPVGKKHKLIGYWHNFVNPAGCPIPLNEISNAWDVIDIAFADNKRDSDGTVEFNLFQEDIRSDCPPIDPVQFKRDMRDLQAQGKIIVLSLGGAEGTITLNTDADEANFISSLTAIIQEWGFDGLDVDYESGSNLVHGSQIQTRLPRALKQIEQNIGGDMYLTMAPEHPYVHGGMIAYSGIWGAYIPLIDELRDTLDLLHVQLYNNGGLPNPYEPGSANEGTVNMMVAHAKMLIEGFDLANGTRFQPLRDDQVAIGLPSGPRSANSGQAPTQNIYDALDCITKGTRCGTIVPNQQYKNFGGVMTWSINWDKYDGYNFSGPIGDKLTQMNQE